MERLLVFQHVPNEQPGFLAKAADDQGVELDVVKLWKPYRKTEISDYGGLIIMGGPRSVYDHHNTYPLRDVELGIIQAALRQKIPILGICLGSQLLAYALGAEVHPNIYRGKIAKEIGYSDVGLTREGINNPILEGFSSPVKVLQWHGDAFNLPRGAKRLATSEVCRNQAFVYGKNAYGFLFHFEFTPQMVDKQIESDRDWIHKDHEMDEGKLREEAREYASLMEDQCRKLLYNFVSIIVSR